MVSQAFNLKMKISHKIAVFWYKYIVLSNVVRPFSEISYFWAKNNPKRVNKPKSSRNNKIRVLVTYTATEDSSNADLSISIQPKYGT